MEYWSDGMLGRWKIIAMMLMTSGITNVVIQ
jgi:hypothetical protein